jgi:glycosyltransferase involved in cell wall biosynthesis
MKLSKIKLSLIIPCYNEEENISFFYQEIKNTFNGKKINLELIFINDGSSDNTLNELRKLTDYKDFEIKIINFSRNFGKEAGMYAGFSNVTGDFVSIIDADLQQSPRLVLDMLDILLKNECYDVVAAYQKERKDSFFKKHFSNLFYKIINKISDVKFKNGASDFRLLRKCVVDSILEVREYYRFSKGIFSWVGYNTYYMEYKPKERINGTTKWSLGNLFKYAFDGIVSYTTFPIKIITGVGCIMSCC